MFECCFKASSAALLFARALNAAARLPNTSRTHIKTSKYFTPNLPAGSHPWAVLLPHPCKLTHAMQARSHQSMHWESISTLAAAWCLPRCVWRVACHGVSCGSCTTAWGTWGTWPRWGILLLLLLPGLVCVRHAVVMMLQAMLSRSRLKSSITALNLAYALCIAMLCFRFCAAVCRPAGASSPACCRRRL